MTANKVKRNKLIPTGIIIPAPKLESPEFHSGEKKCHLSHRASKAHNIYPVISILAPGTSSIRSRSHSHRVGRVPWEMRIAKGLAQSDRKRLSKIIFLFNPFLTHTKKWNVKVWPRARGLDSGLPHATAEARPSPSKPPRSLRARDGRGPRGAEPQDPHARTPHLGAGPSSLSPRPPQAVPPTQSLCPPRPSREPRPQGPTYSLKPRPPPRTKLEAKQRAATRRHHDGVCSSPAAPCVSNLWNAGTTSPRMPCGTAGPPRRISWVM